VTDGTLRGFLEAVAAPTPTPGGGSAAALVGALSTALSRMVAGLAVGKKGYEDVQGELEGLRARGAALGTRLLALAEDDAAAYDAVLQAQRLPRGTDEERARRIDAVQAAYRRATEVPLETMGACLETLRLAALAAEKGNRGATTDAGVAVLLADAALRAASLNVRVNLASIRDEGFRSGAEARHASILAEAGPLAAATMALVEGRL